MDIEIQRALESVRIVDSDRNYWFVRTYGGETFKDYIQRNYIGIGFNQMPYEYLKNYKNDDPQSFERIKNHIEKTTDYRDGSSTKWTNQLINFQHDMKKGDLVVIPNKNSSYFHVGVIDSDVYVVKENITFMHDGKYEKYPEKRRKVNWETNISLDEVRNELKGMTSTRQAITNINRYSDRIEGHISSIYIKEDKIHLVIKVNQDEDINAFDLSNFLSSITYFYKEFALEEDNFSEDLTIKIKLQSRGKTVLKGAVYGGILGIAGLVLLSNNSEFKATFEESTFSFKTEGLLKSVSDFLDREQERKIQYEAFQDSISGLKANVKEQDAEIRVLEDDTSDEVVENREENDAENNSQ